MTGDIWYYNYL